MPLRSLSSIYAQIGEAWRNLKNRVSGNSWSSWAFASWLNYLPHINQMFYLPCHQDRIFYHRINFYTICFVYQTQVFGLDNTVVSVYISIYWVVLTLRTALSEFVLDYRICTILSSFLKCLLCVPLYECMLLWMCAWTEAQKGHLVPQSYSYGNFADLSWGSHYCKANTFNIWAVSLAFALIL